MTAARREAMELLEKVQENKQNFVVQMMQGVNELPEDTEAPVKKVTSLDLFVMPVTERGQNADAYVRELRDSDRI